MLDDRWFRLVVWSLIAVLTAELNAGCPASGKSSSCGKSRVTIVVRSSCSQKSCSAKKGTVYIKNACGLTSSSRRSSRRGRRIIWSNIHKDFKSTFSPGFTAAIQRERPEQAYRSLSESRRSVFGPVRKPVDRTEECEERSFRLTPAADREEEQTVYLPIKPEKTSAPAGTAATQTSEAASAPRLEPIAALKQIHAIQLYVLRRRNHLTLKEYNAEVEKILTASSALENADGELVDIPFVDRMANMNQLLSEIRYGLVKSAFSAKSKSDEQLLLEIQQAQLNQLARHVSREN